MFTPPPLPAWNALHPAVVHFPIALLMVAPILIVLGLLWRGQHRGLAIAALVLMVIGTTAAYVAVSTGRAAEHATVIPDAAHDLFERHEDLGKDTRLLFTVLTGVYAAIVVGGMLLHERVPKWLAPLLTVVFLVPYGAGMLALANTGALGGRLVQEHGVHTEVPPGAVSAPDRTGPGEHAERRDRDGD